MFTRLPALLFAALAVLGAGTFLPSRGAKPAEDGTVTRFRERLTEKGTDRDKLRLEILGFVRKNAGTPASTQAAALLGRLPSPLDRLDAKAIPELDRFPWQPRELVAVLGEHRGRHGAPVTCVAWSKDGKLVVSGGTNGYVRIWDATTLRQKFLTGTSSATQCVAIARDNKTVAAGNAYGGLYVWDISGKAPVLTGSFTIGTSTVYALDFSPDGKMLAAGVYDGLVHLFDTSAAKPRERTQLAGHKTGVRAVRFAPGSKTLATASTDGILRLWGIGKDSVQELHTIEGHPKEVLALDYTPAGTTLAAGLGDGTVWFYNVTGLRPVKRAAFKAHTGTVTALAFTPSGQSLATAGSDGTVRLWNARTRKQVWAIEGHHGPVSGLAFAPGGHSIATGGHDWTVRIWALGAKPAERFPLRGHWARANAVRFIPDGHALASGGEDRSARVWDLTRAGPAQTAFFRNENTVINALAYAPDGKALALAGQSTTISLWDVARRIQLRTFKPHPTWVSQMEYTTDGTRLVASSGAVFVLWNANTSREIFRFTGSEQVINSLSVSADGRFALTGTGTYEYDKAGKIVIKDGKYQYVDCTLRLWDLQRGEKLTELTRLGAPVASVAFAPDGEHAAGSMWYTRTHLWQVAPEAIKDTGEVKTTAAYTSLHVFSPDGKRLATSGNDRSLRVLDPVTGKVAWQWASPQESIAAVAFSPDGRYLAVSLQTGPVYVFRLEQTPDPSSK